MPGLILFKTADGVGGCERRGWTHIYLSPLVPFQLPDLQVLGSWVMTVAERRGGTAVGDRCRDGEGGGDVDREAGLTSLALSVRVFDVYFRL